MVERFLKADARLDYISREAAIDGLYKLPCKIDEDGYRWVLSRGVAHMIDSVPTADVRPVVRGAWKPNPRNPYYLDCTVCGYVKPDGKVYNFCPNCGAEMRAANDLPYENGDC